MKGQKPEGQEPHRIEVRAWWRRASFIAVAVAAVMVGGLALSARGLPPTQPIRFNHKVHVKQAKCQACHTTVTRAAAAGAPKLSDCLDCHEGAQAKTPEGQKEEAKLQDFIARKEEIPWSRVWRLPSHVVFSHRTHVAVGKVACHTCHGAMESLDAPPTAPLKTLSMANCIGCHEKSVPLRDGQDLQPGPLRVVAGRRLSTDCAACHR